ncbi:5-keto-4-deoxy-D-glucarate aldolase [Streptomyces sp. YIM 130001]|uniref:HpcH/HpaI aldolase family protein n=1 Tax=Streptomyces sp. YIM 130001 TaxID=2259644 RepID=UPI000E65CC4E|nr:aldolase/citrate lyase family protein [Streptomyces sp. YIM 130001]RII16090.1 5-keto-4-deoxy-D-glucarate aldolase [Streptomyces sp. YIM 130001]
MTANPAEALTLKGRLRAGERVLGALVRLPAGPLVEMAAVAGLDFVVVDCEHGPADLTELQRHIQEGELHGVPVLVRVGEVEPALILRVLDLGAEGVVVPHVDTPEEAARAVAWAHYPPLGERGFATYGRAGRFGSTAASEHLARTAARTLVVPMLETPRACAAAGAILAVDGVDSVFVGPADLAVATGLTGDAAKAAVRAATAEVEAAAARAGRPVTTIVGSAAQARQAPPGAVVYNLTHVLMGTLRELAAPGGD